MYYAQASFKVSLSVLISPDPVIRADAFQHESTHTSDFLCIAVNNFTVSIHNLLLRFLIPVLEIIVLIS